MVKIMESDGNERNCIELIQGDITRIRADAIVNAANSSLMGGGGVDGAIHRAGGPSILEECRKIIADIGQCKTGQAVYTTAGDLPAKYVIHTVGPVWQGGDHSESTLLGSCYTNSLDLAHQLSCSSISFPNISTGIYGYPKAAAAEVAISAIRRWQEKNGPIKVQLICFDEENYRIYKEKMGSGAD